MAEQWGLWHTGRVTKREQRQKGTNIKEKKSSHQSEAAGEAAQRSERCEMIFVGVSGLTDGELSRRLSQWLSGDVDGHVAPHTSELPRRRERSRRSEPPRRSEPCTRMRRKETQEIRSYAHQFNWVRRK